MRNQTPWQPLALLALGLSGALVLRHLSPVVGAAVAGFGLTGIVLHYRNQRVPVVRRCVPAVEAAARTYTH